MTAIAPIINPLLQRASHVSQGTMEVSAPAVLAIPISTIIPQGFTGYVMGRQYDAALFFANYTSVVQQYYNNHTMKLTRDSGCRGLCKTRVQGVGLSFNCSLHTEPFNLMPSTSEPVDDPAIMNGTNVFDTHFWWTVSASHLQLQVQYEDQAPCSGNLIVRICTLQAAVVTYPIIIDANNTVVLDPTTAIRDDSIDQVYDTFQDARSSGATSTLAGYYLALRNKFDSSGWMCWGGAIGHELHTSGSTALQYASANAGSTTANLCELTFLDPTLDIIASARELMFRTALAVAATSDSADNTMLQTVQALQSTYPPVYRSSYLYLILALTISAAAAIAVSLLFQSYAVLGREVSLSPLETARALGAPLLLGPGSDPTSDVAALVKACGARRVRYGVVQSAEASTPETFHSSSDDTGGISVGTHPATSDEEEQTSIINVAGNAELGLGRLLVADEKDVQTPRTGPKSTE